MKKSLIFIAILFLIFFINQSFVNAEGYVYINMFNSSNEESGNLNPNWININAASQATSNINVGVVDTDHNTSPNFTSGNRFLVKSKWCSYYNGGDIILSQATSGLNIQVNSSSVNVLNESCQFTASDGTVQVGNHIFNIDIDFTILKSGLNPNVKFLLQRRTSSGNLSGFYTSFLNYELLTGQDIINNNNTQDIINNNNDNTQDIINNQNSNTNKIVNAQNGTTNAVNGLNDSVNNTNTTGSENALSSIINDPAFQDNTGINSIITLPVNMISSLSNTCQPITINIPFINSNVQLPCFRAVITQHMPLVANLIGIVVNGFILYRILIDIVGIVKSARNPDEDRLDVLEL